MGSVSIAAWIAKAAFVGLVAWFGLPLLSRGAGALVTPTLALIDIALVLVVFKGDVRIT